MARYLIALLAISVAGCQTSTPANAGEWPFNQYNSRPAVKHHYQPKRHKPKPKVIYRTVKPALRMPGPLDDGPQCHPSFPSVGDQAPTFSAAESAAKKAWGQQARYSFGERYADPENAKDVTFECVKSGTGSLTGDWFNRCQMRGRPCRPPRVGD